jgi:hypothetical protein
MTLDETIEFIRPYTGTSDERIRAMIDALVYVDEANIHGDVVECGVIDNVRDGRLSGGNGDQGTNMQDFNSIAAFKASVKFTLSKTGGTRRGAYAPGFENSGTDTKPTLASLDNFRAGRFQYRPTAQTQVTTATTSSLSGENWWTNGPSWGGGYFAWIGLAPSNWKGALDPSGSSMTVGVQNP